MHTKYKFNLFFASVLFCTTIYAGSDLQSQYIKSSIFIHGLNPTLIEVKKTAAMPAIFPRLVPKDASHDQYYAGYDKDNTAPGKGYLIYVDYTADCNGVHVCNVGYLRAESGKKPDISYDRDNKNITETVALKHAIQGYYTPGHAMGSYFPPMLQWQSGNVLYTLSWDDHVTDKTALIAMADSAIVGTAVDKAAK